MNRKATLRQIPQLIADRKPFIGNSMRGGDWSASDEFRWSIGSGWLTGADREKFHSDVDARRLTYVVLSYETPIAWQTTDGAMYVVAQRFSVTTSRHQGTLRGFPLPD